MEQATVSGEKVWIGLEISRVTAEQFPVVPADPHITIAIAQDWGFSLNDIVSSVIDAISDWCCDDDEMEMSADDSSSGTLVGSTSGMARFNASESSDGKDVLVALVQIKELCELRDKICDEFEEKYISYLDNFEYTPHITLKYLDAGSDLPIQSVPPVGLAFTYVTVRAGNVSYKLPLEAGNDVEVDVIL